MNTTLTPVILDWRYFKPDPSLMIPFSREGLFSLEKDAEQRMPATKKLRIQLALNGIFPAVNHYPLYLGWRPILERPRRNPPDEFWLQHNPARVARAIYHQADDDIRDKVPDLAAMLNRENNPDGYYRSSAWAYRYSSNTIWPRRAGS